MTYPTTHPAICPRPAAPDRHGPKGSVSLTLSPFGPRRPASTVHGHPAARATESIVYRDRERRGEALARREHPQVGAGVDERVRRRRHGLEGDHVVSGGREHLRVAVAVQER